MSLSSGLTSLEISYGCSLWYCEKVIFYRISDCC